MLIDFEIVLKVRYREKILQPHIKYQYNITNFLLTKTLTINIWKVIKNVVSLYCKSGMVKGAVAFYFLVKEMLKKFEIVLILKRVACLLFFS